VYLNIVRSQILKADLPLQISGDNITEREDSSRKFRLIVYHSEVTISTAISMLFDVELARL